MIEATVDTTALRAGLKAILPHVSREKHRLELQNVRFSLGAEHLTLSATDMRTTAAIVMLPVLEHGPDGEIGAWDMSPRDAKDLLTLFPAPAAGEDDDASSASLRFRIEDDTCEVQDVGYLPGLDGKRVTLPSHDISDFPDLPSTLATVLDMATRPAVDGYVLPSYGFTKLGAAADAYGHLDVFVLPRKEGRPSTYVVRGGGRFLGVLIGRDWDPDLHRVREPWLDRLPMGGITLEELMKR